MLLENSSEQIYFNPFHIVKHSRKNEEAVFAIVGVVAVVFSILDHKIVNVQVFMVDSTKQRSKLHWRVNLGLCLMYLVYIFRAGPKPFETSSKRSYLTGFRSGTNSLNLSNFPVVFKLALPQDQFWLSYIKRFYPLVLFRYRAKITNHRTNRMDGQTDWRIDRCLVFIAHVLRKIKSTT